MYHLMGRIKESQYAKLGLLLGFCCITVFIFINLNCTPKSQLQESNMASERDDSPEPMITGGLGSILEKDDEVVEIVNRIKPELEKKSGKKFESLEVVHYKPQVVAGKNYFVKATAKVDGVDQVLHLRIYRDLKGELELTAYQLDMTLGDKLAYFQ